MSEWPLNMAHYNSGCCSKWLKNSFERLWFCSWLWAALHRFWGAGESGKLKANVNISVQMSPRVGGSPSERGEPHREVGGLPAPGSSSVRPRTESLEQKAKGAVVEQKDADTSRGWK